VSHRRLRCCDARRAFAASAASVIDRHDPRPPQRSRDAPAGARLSLSRALELRARCDYRGALAELKGADDPVSLLERSRLHEELGNVADARTDAERALALGGGPEARARLAAVARAERRPNDALALLADVGGLDALVERAGALEELARFDEAEKLLRGIESDDGRIRHALGLVRGEIARGRADYHGAERMLRESIAFAEATFGPQSIETATALNALAMSFKYSGNFDEGADLYRRALSILERAVGAVHPDVASLHHNLGGIEHARGNYTEAEPYARRSVEIRRAVSGADHPAVAEDEAAWASILHALGRDDEAESLLRGALPVLEHALGPEHPEVAAAWNNLAAVLQRREDYAAADEAYRRALAAKERLLGSNHPAVALTLNNLAVNARRRGRPAEAESLYLRALAALERVEPDHPTRLLAVRNYAKLLRSTGRDSEAQALEQRGKNPGAETV
jgi:tetratricopeptide (TPR) repeat protein